MKLNVDAKNWIKDAIKRKNYEWTQIKEVLEDNGWDSLQEIKEARIIYDKCCDLF